MKNSNLDETNNTFVAQHSKIIDDVAPHREIRVTNNTVDWFDGEIIDEIRNRDKLYRKFKTFKTKEGDLN